MSVPVTTVPAPLIVNTRSTNRRVRASVGAGAAARASRRARRRARRGPRRSRTSTATIGAPASAVPAEAFADLARRERERLVVDEVALRERDDPAVDAEDVEDLQVLLGLRLPPLVGRDDEQHQADRPDAGEHVADEPLVARDVDEADLAAARGACTTRTRGRS